MKFFTVLTFVFGLLSLFVALQSSYDRITYNKNEVRNLIDNMQGITRQWPYEFKAYMVFIFCACFIVSQLI